MRLSIVMFALALAGCATSAPAPAATSTAAAGPITPDAVRGAMLYSKECGFCHALDKNKMGPMHAGVFGRKAGAVSDYKYSAALSSSGLTWDKATLDKFLTDPKALVPGAKMGKKVASAQDRADIIAYLQTAK